MTAEPVAALGTSQRHFESIVAFESTGRISHPT